MKRIVMVSRGFLLGITLILVIYFVLFATGYDFKYQIKKVASNSMSPLLVSGDFVLLERTHPNEDYKVNEIYCYYKEENHKLIIHRLIDSVDDKFVFKGDANALPDEVVSKEQIGYRFLSIIRPHTIWIVVSIFGFILLILGGISFHSQRSAPLKQR